MNDISRPAQVLHQGRCGTRGLYVSSSLRVVRGEARSQLASGCVARSWGTGLTTDEEIALIGVWPLSLPPPPAFCLQHAIHGKPCVGLPTRVSRPCSRSPIRRPLPAPELLQTFPLSLLPRIFRLQG